MFKRLFILSILGLELTSFAQGLANVNAGDNFTAGANFLHQTNGRDRIELSAIRDWSWLENISLSARVRVGTNEKQLQTLDWAGEISRPFFLFLIPTVRFYNISQLANGTHHTGIFPELRFEFPATDWLKVRGAFGWYLRWVSLSTAVPLPFWGGTSYYEHDIGFALGFDLTPVESWRLSTTATTYDDFDVHNFNHPLLKVEVGRALNAETEVSAFFRHDFLLGFGRTQSWRLGAAYVWRFTSQSASAKN